VKLQQLKQLNQIKTIASIHQAEHKNFFKIFKDLIQTGYFYIKLNLTNFFLKVNNRFN
jgi:hypothetical protein